MLPWQKSHDVVKRQYETSFSRFLTSTNSRARWGVGSLESARFFLFLVSTFNIKCFSCVPPQFVAAQHALEAQLSSSRRTCKAQQRCKMIQNFASLEPFRGQLSPFLFFSSSLVRSTWKDLQSVTVESGRLAEEPETRDDTLTREEFEEKYAYEAQHRNATVPVRARAHTHTHKHTHIQYSCYSSLTVAVPPLSDCCRPSSLTVAVTPLWVCCSPSLLNLWQYLRPRARVK